MKKYFPITRGIIFELAARMGLPVAEPNLTRYDLMTADECFLTGTAAEIVPVPTIDGRAVGTGEPGRLTLQLMEQFRTLTQSEGTPIGTPKPAAPESKPKPRRQSSAQRS